MKYYMLGWCLAAFVFLSYMSYEEIVLQPIQQAVPTKTVIEDAIHTALSDQRSLGYNPCEPFITELPTDLLKTAWADAAFPIPYNVCEIRWGNVPANEIEEVAWHEVCHLSVGQSIFVNPSLKTLADPQHEDQRFLSCNAKEVLTSITYSSPLGLGSSSVSSPSSSSTSSSTTLTLTTTTTTT